MLKYRGEYTLGLNTFTFEGLEIVFGFIYSMCIPSMNFDGEKFFVMLTTQK